MMCVYSQVLLQMTWSTQPLSVQLSRLATTPAVSTII